MSDTTITPEERAAWMEGAKSLPDGQTCPEHVQITRLLDALEQAEAQLERSVQETRANFSELYRMATEIVPELKKRIAEAEARAEKAEAENARLRERLEAALDKIAEIQENDNWEKADGVCYACGICSGIPDEWQPTDDHCCREILDLWSSGEPLPWEAARQAVAAGEEPCQK